MSKATVELTDTEKNTLVGGPWSEPFPIPGESTFDPSGRLDAPDLDVIARRLIAIDDLRIGHLARFRLLVLWAKSGGTSGGKPRWGSVALANPDVKHITADDAGEAVDAIVRLAADNLREAEATRWQIANELCFQLSRIGLYTTQEGGDERLTLIAPDSAFFTPQIKLFGPQTPELKKTILDIRQARFEWADRLADDIARAEAAKDHDPTLPQAPGVAGEIGPNPDGAPAADWAEPFKGDPDMMELIDGGIVVAQDSEPNDDTHDPETSLPRVTVVHASSGVTLAQIKAEQAAHEATIRERFGTETVDGFEVCRRCGTSVAAHNAEVCEGGRGVSAMRAKRGRKTNGNGAHDPAVAELIGAEG